MKSLGEKLKAIRLQRAMSLDALSKEAGVSKSLLSQIERNISVPTVIKLQKIAEALRISISSMFPENDTPVEEFAEKKKSGFSKRIQVVRKEKRKKLVMPWGAWFEMLCPDLKGKIEFIYLHYPVGVKVDGFYAHEGEECGVVLEGRFKGIIGDQEIILEPGDSVYYDSSIPHTWEATGDTEVKAIWAITPPSF